jgi:hypothetical protein
MAPAGAERMTANTAVVNTTRPYLSKSTSYYAVISSLTLPVIAMTV